MCEPPLWRTLPAAGGTHVALKQKHYGLCTVCQGLAEVSTITPTLERKKLWLREHIQVSGLTTRKRWGWDTSQDLMPHSDTH